MFPGGSGCSGGRLGHDPRDLVPCDAAYVRSLQVKADAQAPSEAMCPATDAAEAADSRIAFASKKLSLIFPLAFISSLWTHLLLDIAIRATISYRIISSLHILCFVFVSRTISPPSRWLVCTAVLYLAPFAIYCSFPSPYGAKKIVIQNVFCCF